MKVLRELSIKVLLRAVSSSKFEVQSSKLQVTSGIEL